MVEIPLKVNFGDLKAAIPQLASKGEDFKNEIILDLTDNQKGLLRNR